jgi:hypothetical protein
LYPPKAQTLVWKKENEPPIVGKPIHWLRDVWVSVSMESLKDRWENECWNESWRGNVTVSREILKFVVFNTLEPEEFAFEDFRHDGWNFLDESLAAFTRRVELKFRSQIALKESSDLLALTNSGGDISEEEYLSATEWRDRKLRTFRKGLAGYTRLMNEHRDRVLKEGRVDSVPSKRKLGHHLRVAIRYQIPNASLSTNSLTSIGKASATSKTVDEILALIGLDKRTPNPTGGRKPGSKNKYSSIALGR